MDIVSDALTDARPDESVPVGRQPGSGARSRSRSRRNGGSRKSLVEVVPAADQRAKAEIVVVGTPRAAQGSGRVDPRAFAQAGRQWLRRHATLMAGMAVVFGAGMSLMVTSISDRDAIDQLRSQVAQLHAQLHGQLASSPIRPGADGKLEALKARLDRLEKQVSSSTTTGAIPPAAVHVRVPAPAVALPPHLRGPGAQAHLLTMPSAPVQSGAAPAATRTGWVLREIYDGSAVIEGRDGVRRVAVGDVVPGAGRIESINRRNGSWVLVATGGTIAGLSD